MEHPNQKSASSRRNKQSEHRRRVWTVVAIVVAVLALIVACGYMYLDNLVNEGDSGKLTEEIVPTQPEYSKKVWNLLVAGIDYDVDDDGRDYSEGLGLTDMIMYVSCDLEKGTMRMLQIPRDSYVGEEVPTGDTGKINAVYSHGENTTDRISNLAKVINDQFQLPVDNYVTIDMAAFRNIIDILGGIEMYVPWDVHNYDENGNLVEEDTLYAGTHTIDGATAELIVRSRKSYPDGDLKRLEMQQYFYSAIFKTFLSFPISDIIKVAPGLTNYINSDLKLPEMISLFTWLQKVDKSAIGMARCPGGGLYETNGHKGMYGINAETLAPLLNEHFRPYGDPVPASELGLPTGLSYPVGEIPASISFMGDLENPAA